MTRHDEHPIVLLCGDGFSSRAIYHALSEKFGNVPTIQESVPPKTRILYRRIQKLGYSTVLGQVLFIGLVTPLLKHLSKRRIAELKQQYHLAEHRIIGPNIHRVLSINSDGARELLRGMSPRVVVVNGTRILEKKTLSCIQTNIINTHNGITPLYRGVHGGYWALAEKKPELVGTTIHYVDHGIDTGGVIRHVPFDVTPKDNFATYPYHHIGVAIPELLSVVDSIVGNMEPPKPQSVNLPSKLRSHPTIFQYVRNRVLHGVK